ncbi:MAG: hypothetical protein DMF68_03770 [Acidobacteria bacterium]|nr:MAG: hypothetical protein DMF68_03770 [Acidobacteriota bacterium]
MNQRKNNPPQANALKRMVVQPADNQQSRRPGIAPPKVANLAQMKKQPVAPPAFRHQSVAKAAQPQMTSAAQKRNPLLSSLAVTPVQMKTEARNRPSALSNRVGVIQRTCGKCGSAYHAQAKCTASPQEQAAYFNQTRSHGWHGKNKSVPKKIKAKQAAKSLAAAPVKK